MARMETIVKQIKPSLENALIQEMAQFGWEVMSTQEVANSYQKREGDRLYNVNEKYVKITFQRDRDRPDYKEIYQLEREYDSLQNERGTPVAPVKPRFPVLAVVIGAACLIAALLVLLKGMRSGGGTGLVILAIVLPVVGAAVAAAGFVFYNKRKKNYPQLTERYQNAVKNSQAVETRIREILDRLREIV